MHECKGEEVLNANLIGASSGRGKGSMKVSLYGTFQIFIADGGWWRLWERPGGGGGGGAGYGSGPSENGKGNQE